MKITINDIAKAANVSKATVSKTINDHPSISEATKERIRAIMKEMNYIPNTMAKNLALKSSYNIVVVIDIRKKSHFLNSFFYNLLGGVENVVFNSNYELTICNINLMDSQDDLLNRFVYNKKADGIIIPGVKINTGLIEKLKEMNFPCVVIGQPAGMESVGYVDINNTVGGELAAAHLVEQGYSKIAFIGGRNDEIISFNRLRGYKNVIEKLNIDYDADYIKVGDGDEKSGYKLMKELLEMENPPDGIICVNNYVAYGAYTAIKESNLHIPEDIGVVAFDNFPLAPYTTPPMTVLEIDTFYLGTVAAQMLMTKIQKPDFPNYSNMLLPKLLVRESTQKAKK